MARQTIQNSSASLYFNGGGSKVVGTALSGLSAGFSMACYFKFNGGTTNNRVMVNATSSTDLAGMSINGSNSIKGGYYTGSYNGVSNSSALSGGRWYHAVYTYNGSAGNMYINGVLDNAATTNPSLPTAATNLSVGDPAGGVSIKGNVLQALFYNRALTAAEVASIYAGNIPTSGLQVNYPLNEGAGSIAYDTSGNGNNGTITSGTWTRDTPTKTRKLVNNNLVYNGDFEIAPPGATNVATTTGGRYVDGTAGGSTTNNIFGWGVVTKTGTAEAIFDSTSPSSGTESMKVSTTATASKIEVGSNGIDTAANNRLSCISVLPSTSYTLTFRMKTQLNSGTATSGARVGVNTFTGAGTYVDTPVLTTAIKTTTDWTTYTSTFTTSATVRLLAVYLIVDGSGGTATLIMDAWFADIQLYPTTPVTRSVATGRLTATGRSAV